MRGRAAARVVDAVLPPRNAENGFTRHDLDRTRLAAALDDAARSLCSPRDASSGWRQPKRPCLAPPSHRGDDEPPARKLSHTCREPTPGVFW
jgi:hypothetical protein